MKKVAYILLVVFLISSCKDDKMYTPKPRMYPKVVYPEKVIEQKDIPYCAFTFKVPNYSDIKKDEYFFQDEVTHPCWFDMSIPELNANLHCSYYPLDNKVELDELIYYAFKVTNEHNKKANYIDDALINIPEKEVYGLMFSVDGPVASPLQFYLTDSTDHFFRAALYFNSKVNADSTAPILNYLREDINTMIGSWEWR